MEMLLRLAIECRLFTSAASTTTGPGFTGFSFRRSCVRFNAEGKLLGFGFFFDGFVCFADAGADIVVECVVEGIEVGEDGDNLFWAELLVGDRLFEVELHISRRVEGDYDTHALTGGEQYVGLKVGARDACCVF